MSRSTLFGGNQAVAEHSSNKRPRSPSLSSTTSTSHQHSHDNDSSVDFNNLNHWDDSFSLNNTHTPNNNEDMQDDDTAPDGSQFISEAERQQILKDSTLRFLPPLKEFLYALHGMLSHPSIP